MAAFEYSSTTAFVREGFNELRAAWKWVLHIELAEISSLSAAIPASRQRPSRSAPVNNSVHSAIFQRSTSSPNFIFRVWMRSISYRPSTSGGGAYSTCKSIGNYGQCLYVQVSMTGTIFFFSKINDRSIEGPYQNVLDAEEQHQLHLGDL